MPEDAEFARMAEFARRHRTAFADFGRDTIHIGLREELEDEGERAELRRIIEALGPWRKGPFELFGERIEANWNSEIKWNRLLEFWDPSELEGARVADIGSNNGYYLFRMAARRPAHLLGLDPSRPFYQAFQFLNALHPIDGAEYLPRGFEALAERPADFDLIFCMGILYHHTDPVEILRLCREALAPGGRLILETMGLSDGYSADPVALAPAGRYAGARGVWLVPNRAALLHWLRRANFRDIVFQGEFDSSAEQVRRGPLPGLAEFLDPDKPERTTEGYPAPKRLFFTARK